VQPWLDFCHDIGVDLDAPQRAHPRVFKSHQRPAALNRVARLASIVREPASVLRSYFDFYIAKDHPLVRGKSLDEWAVEWADVGTSNGTLWEYYVQLFQCRRAAGIFGGEPAARRAAASASPLLLLEYGMLSADLPSHARRCAEWLRGGAAAAVDTTAENVARAARLASREVMSGAARQFDDHYLHERQTAAGCEHIMQPAPKARPVDASRPELSAASQALLSRTWAERVTPRTGLKDYAELAALLAEDHAPWQAA
jgi:hypothetical protein